MGQIGGSSCLRGSLGEPKVQNLGVAIRCHLDVGRLELAVDDAFLVSGAKPLGNLFEQKKRFIDGDATTRDPLGERIA